MMHSTHVLLVLFSFLFIAQSLHFLRCATFRIVCGVRLFITCSWRERFVAFKIELEGIARLRLVKLEIGVWATARL